jgi:hypothetical protein
MEIEQRQTILTVDGGRLVGKTGPVQRAKKEAARAVAGEDPPGAVRAMRPRGQPDNSQARSPVAKTRDRLPPVGFISVFSPAHPGHLLPPGDQAGTFAAGGDFRFEFLPG